MSNFVRPPFSPQAVLAGIIVSNVLPLFENMYYLPSLWRQSQYDSVSVDALAEAGAGAGAETGEGAGAGEAWTEGKRTNKGHQHEGH